MEHSGVLVPCLGFAGAKAGDDALGDACGAKDGELLVCGAGSFGEDRVRKGWGWGRLYSVDDAGITVEGSAGRVITVEGDGEIDKVTR